MGAAKLPVHTEDGAFGYVIDADGEIVCLCGDLAEAETLAWEINEGRVEAVLV